MVIGACGEHGGDGKERKEQMIVIGKRGYVIRKEQVTRMKRSVCVRLTRRGSANHISLILFVFRQHRKLHRWEIAVRTHTCVGWMLAMTIK